MSNLSELIDILHDDGIFHSIDSNDGIASRAVGVAFPITSYSWVLFTTFLIR